jgi:hypothetical protein
VGRPQSSVDEIADAPEEQADAGQRRGEVVDIEGVTPALAAEDPGCRQHAEHAAVERHAAFPDLQRVQPVAAPQWHAVEQYVADAPAQNHAEHRVEQKIIHIGRRPGRVRLGGAPACEPPGAGETQQVHDTVPVDVQGSEVQGNRINVRISKHQ